MRWPRRRSRTGGVWSPRRTETVVLDSTGEQVGSCQRNGNEIVVRSLQTNSNGEAAGVLTKSPVSRMVVTSGPSVTCATEQVDLSDSFAYVQVGLGLDGGYVTVEQPEPQLPMIVARYGPTGERVATSARFAGSGAAKLCSATGLVDTDFGRVRDRRVVWAGRALRPDAGGQRERGAGAGALCEGGKRRSQARHVARR